MYFQPNIHSFCIGKQTAPFFIWQERRRHATSLEFDGEESEEFEEDPDQILATDVLQQQQHQHFSGSIPTNQPREEDSATTVNIFMDFSGI